ncbi:MAG: PQQ-binding-like beta-propeller repeat protein [Pirellula sp.]|jgi:outer membrane protein assembly factor BamB|nr:PQQ-binding-like beta-propeller repeat protein [Pirellula sp.]
MLYRILSILFLLAFVSFLQDRTLADWPQWRGENRDGVVKYFVLPATPPNELTKAWSIEVGEGHSSPVKANGRIYLHTGDGKRETVRCINAENGEVVWEYAYDVNTEKVADVVGRYGYSPRSTPSVAGNFLIAMGASGMVLCLNRETGQVQWQRDFKDEFEIPFPEFGASASPLVIDSQVILHVGGAKGGKLVSVKLGTGETQWSLADDGPSYSSPIVVSYDKNQRMIVTQTQKTFTGVTLQGERLWEIPFKTPYMQNIITTTEVSDMLITGGTSRPIEAYRMSGSNTPKRLWENPSHSLYMNSPVVIGEMVLGVSEKEKGHLFAVDSGTGKTLWKKFQRLGENSELLVCGKHLALMNDSGKLSFLTVSKEGAEVLKEYTLSQEPVTTHPILDGNGIYVKDRTHLSALQMR